MILFIGLNLIYIRVIFGKLIKNGIYNIISDHSYLYSIKRNLTLFDNFKYPNTFFRLRKIINDRNSSFFIIQKLLSKLELGYCNKDELIFELNFTTSHFWNFINVDKNFYIIKNGNNCFVKMKNFKFFCEKISQNKATKFKLIKLFSEIKTNITDYDLELLNKEPIDVLIKYINLRDSKLKRTFIHQIEKDFDNEELKYSIRSILSNIPWIRKIFILMPNNNVNFFKEYNKIADKIIYVKDKDILGYDSSNSNSFQFNYWKMKIFGISDNIIIMDDDYFIGSKLEKSDFFYIENGNVVPLITTSHFLKINHKTVQNKTNFYRKLKKIKIGEQNSVDFRLSRYLSLEFILDVFDIPFCKSIYVPTFSHNAIPINLRDLKEAYNIVYSSKYRYNTLQCPFRMPKYIQFQTFLLSYIFIKYNRKVKNLPYKYISIQDSISEYYKYYKYSLFCINKGSGNISNLTLLKAKNVLEHLFPNPSPYEIFNESIFKSSTFDLIYSMDQLLKDQNNQLYLLNYGFRSFIMNLMILIILFFFKINLKFC